MNKTRSISIVSLHDLRRSCSAVGRSWHALTSQHPFSFSSTYQTINNKHSMLTKKKSSQLSTKTLHPSPFLWLLDVPRKSQTASGGVSRRGAQPPCTAAGGAGGFGAGERRDGRGPLAAFGADQEEQVGRVVVGEMLVRMFFWVEDIYCSSR